MDRTDYLTYLETGRWRRIAFAKKHQHPKCEMCGSKTRLEVHHKTYDNVGNEKLEDLQVLCRWCHELTHQMIKPTGVVDLLSAFILQKNRYRW